jgi:hypothetical protein
MTADLDRLATALETLPQLLHQQARTLVVDLQGAAVQQARDNLTQGGAVDTRGTFDGVLPTEPVETERGWRGEVRATAPQSIFVERGRRPNRRMPPGGVLLGWMLRHGIPADAEFLVRRRIGIRGIPARPFMAPLGRQLEPERRRLLGQVVDAVRAYFRGP